MAEGVSWPSGGIRIIFIVALCLSWLSHPSVNATDNTDIGPQGTLPRSSGKQAIGALARDILDQLYAERHQPLIDTILKRLDSQVLTDDEILWKHANPEWSRDGELTNRDLRLKIIDYIWHERGYQTIAVGVDPISKRIVIAGNIKAFDFWDISWKMRKNKGTKVKEPTIVGIKITDVGFRESDYPIIQEIVAKAFPEHSIVVLSPSEEDLKKLPQTNNDRAQTYHAEMQIRAYFEKHGDLSLDNKQIVASKPYCKSCRENLPPDVIDEMMPPGYNGKNMRWEEPENVIVRDLGVPPAQPDAKSKTSDNIRDLVEELQESGGSCGGRGSRRRRSICDSLDDFTEINADEFHKKIQDLSDGDREKLLSALDEVGMDRLHGSESALKEIDHSYKKWKSSVAKGVMEAVSKGTIIFELLRGGTKSIELEKTAISPKILSESMNQLQEQELESLAKEYEKFKTGETEDPKSFKGFSFSQKFVKRVNLAMFGKNLIGGVLNGDPDSVIAMGGLFVADRGLNEVGEMMAAKGVKMVEAGEKVLGTTLKIAGPIVGSATIGFSIYSFVGHINELKYLEKFCQRNDSLFQDRLKSDCKFDMDITIANTVADEVGIISGVAVIAEGILGLLSVETGPVGIVFAVIDALVAIGTQIYAAVETVAKISSSLVGGLSGWEKFKTGWRSFFGMSPPPDIQHLLDLKKSYNTDVAMAVEILKKADQFQTYVAPTTHTRNHIEVNCKWESRPVDAGRVFADIFSLGIAETHYSKKEKKCDIKQEFEEDSETDFQNWQQLHQFRVEPDTPSWGQLECKPNSLASRGYTNDPQYHGVTNGYLCHNVIAMTAPGRPDLPVLVDLKDGTDRMLGFSNRKHVFLVESGTKSFTGGAADDVFVMKSFPFSGQFDGAGGKNTLVLADDATPMISIDLSSTCQQSSNCESQLQNFQQIIGRSNLSDGVVVACSTFYVDLNGGESASNSDRITIPSSACKTSPVFQLRQFTKIENNHDVNGDFVYQVEFSSGIEAKFNPDRNVHRFIFSNDVITANLSLESGTFVMSNKNEGKEFKSNFITSENFTLMTEAGLSIYFDEDTKSFYGLATPSNETHEVNGLVNYPNRFILVTNESLKIKGGDMDDIFSFSGSNTPSGSIDGAGGVDSIVIQQDFHPDKIVSFDFATKVLSPGGVQLSNIENVIGRRAMAEDVYVTCAAKWLDLEGGTAIERDVIRIPSQSSCASEMTLMVRNFTNLENLAISGDFNYRIDLENSSETNSIKVNREGNATHNYIFQRNSSSVSQIAFNATSGLFKIQFQNESWSGTILGERSTVYLADRIAVEVLPNVHGVVQVQSNSTVNMTGLQNYPNTFVLGAAPKGSNCIGGQHDDSFFIFSEKFHGNLIGGEGNNSIILMDGIWTGKPMIINGINQTVSVKTGNKTEDQLGFSDIQRFFGRVGQSDVVLPACDTALIDTRGGSNDSSTFDLIQISSLLDCYLDLDVAIRPNLIVFNDATEGEFGYEGDFRGGNTSIFLTFSESADHNVILAMDFLQLERLKIHQGRVNMTGLDSSQFSIDFFMPAGTHTHTQPSIVFQDGLQLKVSHYGHHSSTVFGILRNVNSSEVDELKENIETSGLIKRYRKTAKDTRTSVVMQVENGTLVSIGSGGRIDVLTAAPGYTNNILVCNDANETIYRIANGTVNVQILTHPHSTRPKVLDFTDIIKDNHSVVPTLEKIGTDIVLRIEDVSVTIKRLAYAKYEDLNSWQVLLRETYLNVTRDSEGTFELVPNSIIVKPKEHDNVVVNTPNLEYGMQILTSNDSDPILYERLKQGNSLVFTNIFQKDLSKEVATVVFHEFYNEDVAKTLDEKRVVFEVEPGVFINVTKAIGENLPTFEEREWEVFGRANPLVWVLPLVMVVLIASVAAAWWSKKSRVGYQPIGSTTPLFSSWSTKFLSGSKWHNQAEREPLFS